MVVDHLALFAGVESLRWTVGRLAFPLFLLLTGHLARRFSPRLLWLPVLGLGLWTVAPWSSAFEVLYLLAACSLYVAAARRARLLLVLPVALALVMLLNGGGGTPYDPVAALAVACVGGLLPRSSFDAADSAPAWLAALGRYPLSLYAGHVLLLTLLAGGLS